MKISELNTESAALQEAGLLRRAGRAIGDYAASTGILGKNQMAASAGRQASNRENYAFQKMFYRELESGLEAAVKSGMVKIGAAAPQQSAAAPTTSTASQQPAQAQAAPAQPAAAPASRREPVNQRTRQGKGIKESYEDFNLVLESKILNESTISDYITQFVAKETRNLADNPQYSARVKEIADGIQAQITAEVNAGKISADQDFDISGNAAFKSGVKQLTSLISAWTKLGGRQAAAAAGSSDMNNNNVPDAAEREEYKKTILTALANLDFNDKNSQPVLVSLAQSLANFVQNSKK